MSNAEPVQPPVGIDLGTTFSVVAHLDPTGRPISVSNSQGDLLTPSAILFDSGEIIVGKEACKSSVLEPKGYAECVKRDMGGRAFRHEINGWNVPPEVLSALILERLKLDAERRLGPIQEVVITVPAFFDESRRIATQEAGKLAGLKVLDIINEPTAAAITFGYWRQQLVGTSPESVPRRVLVFDLGGGTFDVTILEIDGTRFRTLATDGDVRLGGKDFDERLVNYLAEQFVQKHGIDPRADARDSAQLWIESQEVKHSLSERGRATAVCSHGGIRMRSEVTRETFDQLVRDLVERTAITTNLLVQEAGLTWADIDRVLMVGGSTRVPLVLETIRRVSGKEPDLSLAADEAVAHGAALYAGMIRAQETPGALAQFGFTNVNSHSLGIVGFEPSTRRRVNVKVIPRNTALPHRVIRRFCTAKANQRNVHVQVVEGESGNPDECISLGSCVISGLPPDLPKGWPIEVEYAYASNGLISVKARIPEHRVSAQVEIRRDSGREQVDLATWKRRLTDHKCHDAVANSIANGPAGVELPPLLPNDPASYQRRLDALYTQIGAAALEEAPSQPLLAAYQAAQQASITASESHAELTKIESAAQTGTGVRETIQSQSAMARARILRDEKRRAFDFACLVLGRECVACNRFPRGADAWGLEALRLRKSLAE